MKERELGRVYKDKEIIFSEGEAGDSMYIIQSGKVKITKKTPSGEMTLATLGDGEIFGEMALFDLKKRSATAQADGETRVISIDKNCFFARVNKDPTLAFKILQTMSQRIRMMNEEFTKLKKFKTSLLHACIDVNEICQLILDEARSSIQSDHGSVMLLDENEKMLSIKAAFGSQSNQKVKLKVGQGISGDVLKTGKAELVNNVSLDARFVAGGLNIKSMLCAPLKWKGNTFGVINLSNSSEKLFNLEDLKKLHSLSIYASIAVENAKHCTPFTAAMGDIIKSASLMDAW